MAVIELVDRDLEAKKIDVKKKVDEKVEKKPEKKTVDTKKKTTTKK